MTIRTEITNGKKKMIITRKASGVDKSKEAVLKVMGDGFEFASSIEKQINEK